MEVIFMNVEKKLTRFERARILGARAIQISMGAKPLVDIKDSLDPIDIAYEELKAGVLPLDVIRDEQIFSIYSHNLFKKNKKYQHNSIKKLTDFLKSIDYMVIN